MTYRKGMKATYFSWILYIVFLMRQELPNYRNCSNGFPVLTPEMQWEAVCFYLLVLSTKPQCSDISETAHLIAGKMDSRVYFFSPLLFSVLIPLCHPFFLPREASKIHAFKLSQDCNKKIP